jgi:hypothetical protein
MGVVLPPRARSVQPMTLLREVVGALATGREQTWMGNDPTARLILTEHEGKATAWVYALPRRLDPTACPGTPSS